MSHEVIITFSSISDKDFAMSAENITEFIAEHGEIGRAAFVQAMELITNHVKHGPHMMPAVAQLQ